MPIFRPGPGPYALAVTMTGVRLGERLLEIGAGTPDMFGALAAKVGLSGHAAGVTATKEAAAALEAGAVRAGTLVEVHVAPPTSLPYDADGFDLVVVDCTRTPVDEGSRWLREAFRVLRGGGRLIVVERVGGFRLAALLRSAGTGEAASRALDATGFRPVRKIAERDGWRFTEGLKPRKA